MVLARAMLKSMTAVAAIPHFHYCENIGVDALLAVREAASKDPGLAGAKLTLLPFAIKVRGHFSVEMAHG